jgi:hypothetical protein
VRAADAARTSVISLAVSCSHSDHRVTAVDAAPACTTSVSGTVTAPSGLFALAGVTVYVPSTTPAPLPPAPTCAVACTPPHASMSTTTAADGTFQLAGVTPGTNIPVVIQAGRWRRQLVVPTVAACQDTPLSADDTRLPSSSHDATASTAVSTAGAPLVDLPMIAVESGDNDPVECILMQLGLDPSEFGNGSGSGHVQLYWNPGAVRGDTTRMFGSNATYGDVTQLWSSYAALSQFDVVILGDDADSTGSSKPPSAISAVGRYADTGGQLVLTGTTQSIWIGSNAVWAHELTFDSQVDGIVTDAARFTVDGTTNSDGATYADWLYDVGASAAPGTIYVSNASYQCVGYDAGTVARWLYATASASNGEESGDELMSFATPVGGATCGQVVYSDFDVAFGAGNCACSAFPSNCADATTMTPQTKALAYLLFGGGRCQGTSPSL